MDILSIRKKKAADAAARGRETTPPTSSATMTPTTAAPTTVSPTTTQTAAPMTTTTPTAMAPTMTPTTAAPTTVPPSQLAPTTVPQRVASDDPLRDFLARYDDDDGVHDFGQRTGAVEATERFLTFHLQGESYAASIMDVREILKVRSLTDVPRAPRPVLGVISKRGVVLPVVDLAVLLGLRAPDRRLNSQQRVLVVGEGERVCGLRVDTVAEVVKLGADQVEGVPPSLGTRNAGLLVGLGRVEEHMYIVLDLQAVLDAFAASLGLPPSRRESA
jgi:purine-binding chemotaxis protein CheW